MTLFEAVAILLAGVVAGIEDDSELRKANAAVEAAIAEAESAANPGKNAGRAGEPPTQ